MENNTEHEITPFCKCFLKFWPFAYQERFLRDCISKDRIVGLWCRQSGKSTSVAAFCIYRVFTLKSHNIMIVAPTQQQSSELFLKISTMIRNNPLLQEHVEKHTATELFLKNGSRIKALPSGDQGDTIRGFTANDIIIEESGAMKESIIQSVINPMAGAQLNPKIIHIGTPGIKNHFYQAAYGDHSSFVLHHVPWQTAVSEGRVQEVFINEQKEGITDLAFRQEYCAEFVDEASKFFGPELLEAVHDQGYHDVLNHEGFYSLGIDFARLGQDCSVLFLAFKNVKTGIVSMAGYWELSKVETLVTASKAVEICKKFRVKRVFCDVTGVGAGATEVLKTQVSGVSEVTFTMESKMDMYNNLKVLLQNKQLFLVNERKFLFQMRELEYEYSTQSLGKFKIHHPERGHDDGPDACALACLAFRVGHSYTPILAAR